MKKGVCVSDLHCGSTYGMLPKGFITFEGIPKLQNIGQHYLWDCWLHFVGMVREFKPDFVIVNGDDVDGMQDKQRGAELCLSNWKDQRQACINVLKPLRAASKGATWLFTQGCLVPGHKVLTADLRWKPVESLSVGEDILTISEDISDRHWQRATVTATVPIKKKCVKIYLEDGTTFECTEDHPFATRNAARYAWVQARELKRTCKLAKFLRPWHDPAGYDLGWLSGIFDGEGSVTQKPQTGASRDKWGNTFAICFAQKPGLVLERTRALLDSIGIPHRSYHPSGRTSTAEHLYLAGGTSNKLRFLGTVRPIRLLNKFDTSNLGQPRSIEQVQVVDKKFIGEREVVGLSTSCGTYLSDGYLSHNTPYHVGNFSECEEDIAEALNASKYPGPGGGKLCHDVLTAKIDGGVIIEAAHHISFASVYRATPLEKEAQATWHDVVNNEAPLPDLQIRSHVHNYTQLEQGKQLMVTTPCWQLQNRFPRKASVHRNIPHIGGIFIEADNEAKQRGEPACRVRRKLYKLPPLPIAEF